ncbi:copper transporter [Crassisporium funariophilum]|nr:copper transporter [Crassisporium funariophilum]
MDHGTDPMSSDPMSSSSMSAMMVPYLHFQTGDYLYFQMWRPTSAGAIAGACIGLIVLALLERWIAATRSVFYIHWHQRALALTSHRDQTLSDRKAPDNQDSESLEKSRGVQEDVQEIGRVNTTALAMGTSRSRLRTITPFIPAHDIPRGILYALQMLLMYILMLAVMTFQAAFIISIVLGSGIGEVLFGRMAGQVIH